MNDTRIALLTQGWSSIKKGQARIAHTHLGRSVVLWDSSVAIAFDTEGLTLTPPADAEDVVLEKDEFSKAKKVVSKKDPEYTSKVLDLIWREMRDDDADPHEYLDAEPITIDPWTDELDALAALNVVNGFTKSMELRPNLAVAYVNDDKWMTITDGVSLIQATTELPADFRMPMHVLDVCHKLSKKGVSWCMVHGARFDGLDVIRVDGVSKCGHAVSVWGTYDAHLKYPTLAFIQDHFEESDRRLDFFDLHVDTAKGLDVKDTAYAFEFNYENGDVRWAYPSYEESVWCVHANEVWDSDEPELYVPESKNAFKDVHRVTTSKLAGILSCLSESEVQAHMHKGRMVKVYGVTTIGNVNIRAIIVPLKS